MTDVFTLRDRLSSVFLSSHIVSMPLESMDDTAGKQRWCFVTQHVTDTDYQQISLLFFSLTDLSCR